MSGRRLDSVWQYFIKVKSDNNKCVRAKCKKCSKEMAGLVARLKKHVEEKCSAINSQHEANIETETDSEDDEIVLAQLVSKRSKSK